MKSKFLKIISLTILLITFCGVMLFVNTSHSHGINNIAQMQMDHQNDSPIPTPLAQVKPKIPVTDELVIYGNSEKKPLIGYLSHPVKKTKSMPSLIIIHEWWGLNDNIKSVARTLAGEGYVTLAVDLYQGKVADKPERAKELVTIANNKPNILRNNLKQAYTYLKLQQKVGKIGSLGWCFGGTWSLNTALLFPDKLNATVIYYGGGITTEAKDLKKLKMPILGIFGALDQNPTVETVKKFEQVLKSLGKVAEIHIYEDANHGFANPSGTRYNAKAAEDAWGKTLTFLSSYLQK